MKKYIVSDLHGDGNVYNSIMAFLENKSLEEDVTLYINGDLIDRGIDSASMLLDVIKRTKNNPFKIVYLGGNHELMMIETFRRRVKGLYTDKDDWFFNGGHVTDDELSKLLNYDKNKILEVVDYLCNLKLYQKFEEKQKNKPIVLVHAMCPLKVKDECDIKLGDNNPNIDSIVWTREHDIYIPFRCRVGDEKYFTVIGHTAVKNSCGFEYFNSQNYLDIDGGCGRYMSGQTEYDHSPLVEINDGYLKILTFNNSNEIVCGNYFENNHCIPMTIDELNQERCYLDKSLVPKKLVLYHKNIYED